MKRCWAAGPDSIWTSLNETRENMQLIQCNLVITKTNNKPWHQWSHRVLSSDRWVCEILSRREMATDKKPFDQLCNQVIAIKSLSLGRYRCMTGSSILYPFERLWVFLCVYKCACMCSVCVFACTNTCVGGWIRVFVSLAFPGLCSKLLEQVLLLFGKQYKTCSMKPQFSHCTLL